MKVLHVFNRHRGGGGSDNWWDRTISLSREYGLEVKTFSRDSRDLPSGVGGDAKAFFAGLYALDAVREFKRTLADFRPDIVHAHELYPLISPWVLPAAAKAGIPAVFTCSDYRLTCPIATHFSNGKICHRCEGGREYWALLKNCRGNLAESLAYALRNAVARIGKLVTTHVSQFLVQTEFGKDWLTGTVGIPEKRVAIDPCTVDVPDTPVDDPSAGEYVAFAGRFVPEKGAHILIEAARIAGLPLQLAGDARSHPAIRAGDAAKCVVINDPVKLADFYRRARTVVMPSLWNETFGLVAAEAMGHGVPVVASRIGALEYTVRDGVSGLLVKSGDVDELAAALKRIWDDPELCRTLGAGARKQVEENFSNASRVDRLVTIYERAIESPVTL